MIKVALVDDHKIVREGLKQILEDEVNIKVVGEISNGIEVVDYLKDHPCDILLLDMSMPGKNGLEVLADIKAHYPKTAVLFLSMYPENQYAIRAFRAGASGYLCKSNASDELLKAIDKIASGSRYITPELAEIFANQLNNDQMFIHEKLSDREFQVMCMIGKGLAVKDIAADLGLSSKTVSTHRDRILKKMAMGSNAELIKYCIHNDLV